MELTSPQKAIMTKLLRGDSLFITGFQQTGKTTILNLYKQWITINKPELTPVFLEDLNTINKDTNYIILVDNVTELKETILYDPETQEPVDTKVQKIIRPDFWTIPELKRRIRISQIIIVGYWFRNFYQYCPGIKFVWLRRPLVRDNDMLYDLPETDRLRTSESPSPI